MLVVDCEVPNFVVEAAVKAGRRRSLAVVLDPSPADRVGQHLLADVDVVSPNQKEAERLTDATIDRAEAAHVAAARLIERGAGAVCVRLPDGACVVADEHEAVHVMPLAVDVVDATGAGDAFAGALAVALLEKRPLVEAACFATAASHIAVGRYGSQPAYPSREELEAMFRKLRSRVRMLGK